MAVQYNIVMKVDPSGAVGGARAVEGALTKVQQKVLDVNQAVRRVFGFFAIREAIEFVGGLANGWQELQNKLRVVTTTQANLNTVSRETFRIAQLTRSSWEGTATMFQRLSLNSKTLGASQRDILNFTRQLNQAVVIGGATSMESRAGLTQLSQGMASGTLRGDELRSVLEQLPVVADVISHHLGISRGELRKFGTEGKITGKVILDAFTAADKELSEQFNKTLPTMGQSWEMVKNSAMKFFGEAGSGSGVLSGLAQVLAFVADNFETIGKVILATGQVLGVYFGVQAIGKVIEMLKALGMAFVNNPVSGFLLIVIAGIAVLRQFGDQLETTTRVWNGTRSVAVTIGDTLRALWKSLKELGTVAYDFVAGAWKELTSVFSDGIDTGGFEFSLHDALLVVAGFIGAVKQLFTEVRDHGKEMFGSLGLAIAEKIIDALNVVLQKFSQFMNFMRKGIFDLANDTSGKRARANTYGQIETKVKLLTAMPQIQEQSKIEADAQVDRNAYGPGIDSAANKKKWEAIYTAGLNRRITGIQDAIFENAMAREGLDKEGNDPRVGSVDLTLTNPLKGAGGFASAQWGEARDAMKYAAGLEIKRVEEESKRQAIARSRDEDSKYGGLEGATGDAEKLVDEKGAKKAAAELARLNRELDALIRKSSPMEAAKLNLANAEKFLDNPKVLAILLGRGLTASTVISNYAETLKEELDPLTASVDAILARTAAMHGSNEQEKVASQLAEAKQSLDQKGLQITEAQENYLRRYIEAEQEQIRIWEIQKNVLEQINGPLRKYADTLKAIADLKARGDITGIQAEQAARKAQKDYTDSNDGPYDEARKSGRTGESKMTYELTEQLKTLEVTAKDVAVSVRDAFEKELQNIEKFFYTLAETGKFSFSQLYEGIIHMLNVVAMKILEMRIMAAIAGVGSNGGTGPVGSSGMGMESMLGAVAGAVIAGGGHAYGGSYIAGGSGGPDSQHVMFRMSPGERADFTPPGRITSSSAKSGEGGGRGRGVSITNVYDTKTALMDAMQGGDLDHAIINVLARNQESVRRIGGSKA